MVNEHVRFSLDFGLRLDEQLKRERFESFDSDEKDAYRRGAMFGYEIRGSESPDYQTQSETLRDTMNAMLVQMRGNVSRLEFLLSKGKVGE